MSAARAASAPVTSGAPATAVARPSSRARSTIARVGRTIGPRCRPLTVALAGFLGVFLGSGPATAQDLVIRGGEVRPVSGPAVPGGVVIVRDGRIVDVGPVDVVGVPMGVEVIDAADRVVTPGFIDGRTRLGLGRRGALDRSSLVRSGVRVADDLEEPVAPAAFGMAEASGAVAHPWLADGVTAVYVAPSPGNLVGAFGAVVKLEGDGFGAVVDSAAALHVSLAEDPLVLFDAPTTRQGMVAVLRQWLLGAGARMEGRTALPAVVGEDTELRPPTPPGPDLVAVLRGERPVRFYAHAPDDIRTALRLSRELGLHPVIDGASGAHEVAGELAAQGAAVVVGPSMVGLGGGGPAEMYAHTAENGGRLARLGVPVALSTDDARGRSVTAEAVVARGHGLPEGAALRALTLDAARILGVDDRLGSLETGKDADLVVWEGDPVGTGGRVTVVVVDGRVVYRR